MNPTTVVLSSLVFALAAFHGLFWAIYHPPTELSESAAQEVALIETYEWKPDPICEDGNPCTRDLGRLVGGVKQCRYARTPGGGSCDPPCPDACTNTSDCATLFNLTDPLIEDGFETRPLKTSLQCIHGQCLFGLARTLLTTVRQDAEWWTAPTGPHLAQAAWSCERAVRPVPGMVTESLSLDPGLVDYFDTDVLRWGVPLYPVQLGLCLYTFPCQGPVEPPVPSPS